MWFYSSVNDCPVLTDGNIIFMPSDNCIIACNDFYDKKAKYLVMASYKSSEIAYRALEMVAKRISKQYFLEVYPDNSSFGGCVSSPYSNLIIFPTEDEVLKSGV